MTQEELSEKLNESEFSETQRTIFRKIREIDVDDSQVKKETAIKFIIYKHDQKISGKRLLKDEFGPCW